MNQTPPTDTAAPIACATDRSCVTESGWGGNPAPSSGRRNGVKAAVLGVLCVLGCLAVPIAIGGFAAIGGAAAGEAWLIVAGLAIAGLVAVLFKRRGSGSIC